MGIKMRLCDMNRVFRERDKNNCIYFNNGSYIGSGEHIFYGNENKLGYALEIIDKGYISKEHRNACGIGRKVAARAKYALVREFQVTRFGEDEDNNPNPALYPNLPKFLPEATPTATCSYIAVEEVKDIALVFHIDELQAGLKDPGGLHNAFFTFQCRNPGFQGADCNHWASTIPFPTPRVSQQGCGTLNLHLLRRRGRYWQ